MKEGIPLQTLACRLIERVSVKDVGAWKITRGRFPRQIWTGYFDCCLGCREADVTLNDCHLGNFALFGPVC